MLFCGKVCLGKMYSETTNKTILINIAAGQIFLHQTLETIDDSNESVYIHTHGVAVRKIEQRQRDAPHRD
jgi:hypothetical protein